MVKLVFIENEYIYMLKLFIKFVIYTQGGLISLKKFRARASKF